MQIRIPGLKALSRCLVLGAIATSIFTFSSCGKKDKPGPVVDTTPQITSFDPKSGAEGATVKLAGKNFSATLAHNTVTFNGKAAAVTSVNTQGTELMVTVPADATSGRIVVTVGGKSATTTENFTVNPSAPTIATMTPDKGEAGITVTLTGTNFKVGATKVFFNNLEVPAADVNVASKTSLTAKVPAGATTGNVKVVTGTGLEAISATAFYIKPIVGSFTPASAKEGDVVIITGNNFSTIAGETIVNFGSKRVPDEDVQVVSATELRVKVPAGVSTNSVKIYVTVKDQMVETATNFTVVATLISYTPDHGLVGSVVTLIGKSLALNAQVYIGSLEITDFEEDRSVTQIKFKVPATASTGKITIKQNGVLYEFGNYVVDIKNAWVKRNDGFSETYNHGVSFTISGKIYMGLGRNSNGATVNNNFKVYDPNTNTWTAGPSIPTTMSPRALASCFVLNNKAYIGFGNTTGGELADWWEYDPSKTGDAAWTNKANFPGAAYGGIAFVAGGRAFAMNFYFSETVLDGLQEYTPSTNHWTKAIAHSSSVPNALYGTFFVLNGKGYFGGGWASGTSDLRKAFVVDPSNLAGGFQPIADFPANTSPFAGDSRPCFALNGKGYLITSGNMYEYSPAPVNTWTVKCTAPVINGLYNATVINGKAYTWDRNGVLYEYIPE